jgi:chemotaxis protein methyltransferase CheR
MEELKNIMEDLVLDTLEKIMEPRKDICRCEQCRIDIIAHALNRLPAKYVTTDVGSMYTIIEQTKNEFQQDVQNKIEDAIKAVDENPRHQMESKLLFGEEQALKILLEKIFADRGLDCRQYQEKCLKRRIAVRMRSRKVRSYAEYLRVLINDPKEYEELFNTLTINVTEFLRNPETFEAFKGLVLKPLIEDKKKSNMHNIKIWSAGCSDGEEPYSIAMLLREILENEPTKFLITIYATDIDQESLEKARKAEYEHNNVENVSRYLLGKYFEATEADTYKIKKEVKDLVKFQHHNLLSDKPPSKFDIIFCRNVMIYFNRQMQDKLYRRFYGTLNPGGFLVTGKVEMLPPEIQKLFKRVSPRERIYQKAY